MKCDTKEQFEKVNMFGTGAPNNAFAKFFIWCEPVSDEDYNKLG